ncbi:hypothetical protein MTP99_017178 [Tenebrio molitor]|jgi:hypothetical protein|nr:hypothetical protein MTP99_017178 [Tenebrio molitor]
MFGPSTNLIMEGVVAAATNKRSDCRDGKIDFAAGDGPRSPLPPPPRERITARRKRILNGRRTCRSGGGGLGAATCLFKKIYMSPSSRLMDR